MAAQFNNTTYPPGYLGIDDGGVPTNNPKSFQVDAPSTYTVNVSGTVNQAGDKVTMTYGSDAPAGYAGKSVSLTASGLDNQNQILFTSTDIPPGETDPGTYRYLLSNQQVYGSPPPAGQTRTRFTDDGDGQTSYNVSAAPAPCYCTGTLILTKRGEVAVEDLKIGDGVITAAGLERPIKWIGTRSYAGRFINSDPYNLPICFKAGSIADAVPTRDLWVSPKHAMFLDGYLIPAEHLVNGASIIRADRVESVTYWHIELDSHDVIIAEGAESESFVDDDSRCMFQNSRSFKTMYPDEVRQDAIYCAPRLESGFALEAVRQRLAERAGVDVKAAKGLGELTGHVDGCNGRVVWGWAQGSRYPDAPVCLEVIQDGLVLGMIYAEEFRSDLADAGVGTGHHAFTFVLPTELAVDRSHSFVIRRSADGVVLGTAEWGEVKKRRFEFGWARRARAA